MAGSTRQAIIAAAIQSGEGVAATAPQYRFKVNGQPDLAPTVERSQLEETGQGLDGSDEETNRIAVTGGFTTWARPAGLPFLLYAALGAKAVTGVAPSFSHAMSAADGLPWLTLWRCLYGSVVEKFIDCKVVGLNLTGNAGQSLQAAISIAGKNFLKDTGITWDPYADGSPAGGGALDSGVTIRQPGATFNVNAARSRNISEWGMNIETPHNTQQTDDVFDQLIEVASRTIAISWTETNATNAYFKTVYGGTAGVNPSQQVVYEPLAWSFVDGNNTPRLTLDVPRFGYGAAPLQVSSGGDLNNIPVEGRAAKPASGPIITVTTENDIPAYSAAA